MEIVWALDVLRHPLNVNLEHKIVDRVSQKNDEFNKLAPRFVNYLFKVLRKESLFKLLEQNEAALEKAIQANFNIVDILYLCSSFEPHLKIRSIPPPHVERFFKVLETTTQ